SGYIQLPIIPEYATNNAHMFYIVCSDLKKRSELISYLKESGIHSVFHYLSLNKSEYYLKQNKKISLQNSDKFADCLLRLPMYY
ncbi:DegT/DnrJ/EryC1/StrS family aminotransferase, partial [Pseudomonas aeruginosa]